MNELMDLAARVEEASGPDFWLDRAICNLVRPKDAVGFAQPDYTDSIDDALSLVPQGWEWLIRAPSKDGPKDNGRYFARIESPDFEAVTWGKGETWLTDIVGGFEAISWAASPALALVVVALRARAASVDRSGEADETSTKIEGSAEGESAVPATPGDAPQTPPSESPL